MSRRTRRHTSRPESKPSISPNDPGDQAKTSHSPTNELIISDDEVDVDPDLAADYRRKMRLPSQPKSEKVITPAIDLERNVSRPQRTRIRQTKTQDNTLNPDEPQQTKTRKRGKALKKIKKAASEKIGTKSETYDTDSSTDNTSSTSSVSSRSTKLMNIEEDSTVLKIKEQASADPIHPTTMPIGLSEEYSHISEPDIKISFPSEIQTSPDPQIVLKNGIKKRKVKKIHKTPDGLIEIPILKKRHHQLSISGSSNIEYYYNSPDVPHYNGELIFNLDDHSIINQLPDKKSKRPPLSPKRIVVTAPKPVETSVLEMEDSLLKKRPLIPVPTSETPNTYRLLSDSESEEEVMTLKSHKFSMDFLSTYNLSEQESQLTFRESCIYFPQVTPKRPSLHQISQLPKKSAEDPSEQSILVQNVFQSNDMPETDGKEKRRTTIAPHQPLTRKRTFRNIQLTDKQRRSIASCDPNEFPIWVQIRDKISKETNQMTLAESAKPKEEWSDFSLTRLDNVASDEIILLNNDETNVTYVDIIDKNAFMEFRFGPSVTESCPDKLHIFAWHNLGIKPTEISDQLVKYVQRLFLKANLAESMKCLTQYLYLWIFYFAVDFYEDQKCAEDIDRLLNEILKQEIKDSTLSNYIYIIRALILALAQKQQKPENYTYPLSKPVFSSLVPSKQFDLIKLEIKPDLIVKHFTYIELEIFHQIQRREYMRKNWDRAELKRKLSPHFNEYANRFNCTTAFIATSIMVDTIRTRAKNIEYWIEAMSKARKYRNYQLVFEIDAALSCVPIYRLRETWNLVSQNSRDLFNTLHNITNPSHQYIRKYRAEITESVEKTLPFFGPFLSQLIYIYDGNKAEKPLSNGKNGYNMACQRAYMEMMDFIFQDWGCKMEFNLDETVLTQCQMLNGRCSKTDELYNPSIRYEPKRNGEIDSSD